MNIRHGVTLVALGVWGCGDNGSVSFPPRAEGSAPEVAPPKIGTEPVLTAAVAPPPISGGTLLITRDGSEAVAADPDRDRVSIVSLLDETLRSTVALNPGDEPGRLVEDANRRIHVALRRGGAVVTIDVATGEVLARRSVCGAPRGIAYEETTDRIHVACAGGDLVSFPAGGGDAVRRLKLDVDLRDVVVQGARLVVSRFKSGEILFVDADGNVTGRTSLHGITRKTDAVDTIPAAELVDEATSAQPMQPAVAWRTIASPTGALFVLHQYGLAAGIDLNVPPSNGFGEGSGNAYGGSTSTCAALVQPAVSRVDGQPSMGMPIAQMGLTVDAAVSVDGELLALVDASTGRVKLMQSADILASNSDPTPCAQPTALNVFSSQPIAVAFNPIDDLRPPTARAWLVVQTRQPARVVIFGDESPIFSRSIDLGGEDVSDTGHELFHKLTAAQIACASCHSEGGEDGRVWKFVQTGDRRTQAVHTGLKGTEPFHWDGDMTDFGMLVTEVMVHRMGGAPQSLPRQAAFERWLFQLRPPAAIVAANDDRALRGRALFESAEVGCSGCHAGSKLTNNQSVFVGTTTGNHPLQVPSLRGVGFRAPFLHDGCAATLRGRFDPACGGGDLHGKTSQLNEAQIGDLLAYLESL